MCGEREALNAAYFGRAVPRLSAALRARRRLLGGWGCATTGIGRRCWVSSGGGSELAELYRDERLSLHAVGAVFVARWVNAPRLPQMDALEAHGRAWEAEIPGGCALVNVVLDGRPEFSNAVRARAAALTADAALFARCRVHAVLLGGFAGVAVQMFTNTFLLLGRPPKPSAAVRTLEHACAFVQPHLDAVDWAPPRLGQTLDAVVAATEATV